MNAPAVLGLALAIAGATIACAPRSKPVGGIVVLMKLDASLRDADLTRLHVGVRSTAEGGADYRNETYTIAPRAEDSADAGAAVTFPATLPIESNGVPSASIFIDLVLWQGPSGMRTPVDVREYQIVDLPTSGFTELVVVFGGACEAKAMLVGGQAVSLCPSGQTCTDPGSGGCAGNVISASQLPPYAPDAGAPLSSRDAAAEADAGDAALEDAGPRDGADEGADVDATIEPFDAAGDDGDDGGVLVVPPPTPCVPACTPGSTHCIGGACVPVPPSCAGTDPGVGYNCGGLSGSDDCCEWLDVSGGSFYRSYDSVTHPDKSAPATVSSFGLDVYEVTVGRFRKFVAATVGNDAAAPWVPASEAGRHTYLNHDAGLVNGGGGATVYESGWRDAWTAYLPATTAAWNASLQSASCSDDAGPTADTWTTIPRPPPNGNENLPINCVNWYQAYAFCIWDGGFLPSATEWNRAAAPPDMTTGQRIYAWGSNDPLRDCKLAIWGDWYAGGSFSGNGNDLGTINIGTVGVASQGRGLWGQYDLTGNVWEWTLDYSTGTLLTPCVDCADTAGGSQRMARGGAFDDSVEYLTNSAFAPTPPDRAEASIGFRCARAP